jgi:hypothetical protein
MSSLTTGGTGQPEPGQGPATTEYTCGRRVRATPFRGGDARDRHAPAPGELPWKRPFPMRVRTQRIHKHTDLCGSAAAPGWCGRRQFPSPQRDGADAPGKHTRAVEWRADPPEAVSGPKGTNAAPSTPPPEGANARLCAKKNGGATSQGGPRRRRIELLHRPLSVHAEPSRNCLAPLLSFMQGAPEKFFAQACGRPGKSNARLVEGRALGSCREALSPGFARQQGFARHEPLCPAAHPMCWPRQEPCGPYGVTSAK